MCVNSRVKILCQFIASIYPHVFTSFGRFNLIFNKIVLIFLGVLIVFTVSACRKVILSKK